MSEPFAFEVVFVVGGPLEPPPLDPINEMLGELYARILGEEHLDDCAFCSMLFGNRRAPSHQVPIDDDEVPYDLRPNACWRCDASDATTEVGLCAPCNRELTEPEPEWRGQEPYVVILDEIQSVPAAAFDAVADYLDGQ